MTTNTRHVLTPARALTVLVVALGVAALLVGAGALFWYFRLALPPETDALPRINAMMAEASGDIDLDSDDNAVTHLRRMYEHTLGEARFMVSPQTRRGNALFQEWHGFRADNAIKNFVLGAWEDPRHGAVRNALPRLRPILDALDRAADAPGYRVEYTSSGEIFAPAHPSGALASTDILLPQLSEWLALGMLNAAAMRESANSGDWDDAARRVRTGVRFARHLWGEVFIINAIVAISIEDLTLTETQHTLSEHDVPADALREIIRAIEDVGDPPSLEPAIRAAAAGLPDAVRVQIEQDASDAGGGHGTPGYWAFRLGEGSPRKAVRDGLAHYREVIEYERMTRAQRAVTPLPTPRGAGANYVSSLRFFQMRDRLLTRRAATLATLRIALFRAEHARLPATLEEAMTREQTLDPVSGEPFVYEAEDDGATHQLRTPPGATHVPDHERSTTPRRAPLPEP